MELLQAPEGDIVATHPATLFGRILAVLMMVLPGAAMVWFGMQVSGSDADARMPLLAGTLQVVHQRRPRGIEDFAQPAHAIEVVDVRVPAEREVVGGAERDFDEWHAALDEPTRQQ